MKLTIHFGLYSRKQVCIKFEPQEWKRMAIIYTLKVQKEMFTILIIYLKTIAHIQMVFSDVYVHSIYIPLTWNCFTREPTLIYHVSYEMYHLMIGSN